MKNFDDLLKAARNEQEPQRLLFLFAKASPMKGAQRTRHHSGTIAPVMCVDKLPEEISTFENLLKEADSITSEWDFILIGSIAGKNGFAPVPEEADPHLHKMSNDLANGADLSRYIILDREQRVIIVS